MMNYSANDVKFTEVMLKVQLMEDGKVIYEKPKLVKGWKAANHVGAKMLKEAGGPDTYVRFYDPHDGSCVEFVTRKRIKVRRYTPERNVKIGESD